MKENSNKNSFIPLSETNKIVVQELENELLIYNLKTNKAFCLNKTSAFVWQNADGKKSVNQISKDLSAIYKEKIDDEFVWFALNELAKENLITNLPENTSGMNRREVIKRIGIGTAIALPIISGLVAPTAVHAASTCNLILGDPCSSGTRDACLSSTGCRSQLTDGVCIGGRCCCPSMPL